MVQEKMCYSKSNNNKKEKLKWKKLTPVEVIHTPMKTNIIHCM